MDCERANELWKEQLKKNEKETKAEKDSESDE
jgi:hypothetical protein